jgi:hypothetical protein
MDRPQYAWKQVGKKSVWFSDKKMCLMHCKQHKTSTDPVYLYKRVPMPSTRFILKSKYEDFRWKVKAYFAFRQRESDWTLLKSKWFDDANACLRDFKDLKGYDVADCWGTTHHLVMRRVLGDRKRQYFLKHLDRPTLEEDSLDI